MGDTSCFCCGCVSTGEVRIVERNCKYNRLAMPGITLMCWPFEVRRIVYGWCQEGEVEGEAAGADLFCCCHVGLDRPKSCVFFWKTYALDLCGARKRRLSWGCLIGVCLLSTSPVRPRRSFVSAPSFPLHHILSMNSNIHVPNLCSPFFLLLPQNIEDAFPRLPPDYAARHQGRDQDEG